VWFRGVDERFFEESYRRAPQLLAYFHNEPHLRPYVTFAARPSIESPVLNTDTEGFRVSSSPLGPVDTRGWRAGGGGGLVLGGSFTFGVGATCDGATLPSRLAWLSGSPQLNLGICAGNSLQELIAAVPFLEAATTVVVCSGANTILASLQSLGLNDLFGPLFFEAALARLGTLPIGDIVQLAAARRDGRGGRQRPDRAQPRPPATRVAPRARTEEDLATRLEAAMGLLVRDLEILSRACRGRARVLFCLQPFAGSALRDLTREERELFDLHARHQGAWSEVRDFVAAHWQACAGRMAGACASLEVRFLDLSAGRFEGWSFLDHVHMTDDGYRQAAGLIWEALR
jgi:hypothetical protein